MKTGRPKFGSKPRNGISIKEITGRSVKVVKEYIKLYKDLNPEEVTKN